MRIKEHWLMLTQCILSYLGSGLYTSLLKKCKGHRLFCRKNAASPLSWIFFQEYLRIFLTNPYPPTKWRHSYILFYKNALITDLRYPHLFYKKKHTFWKGLRKQNLLNDFKKAFFFFLNRVFQLPLPLDLDILREPRWKGFFKKQNASQRE